MSSLQLLKIILIFGVILHETFASCPTGSFWAKTYERAEARCHHLCDGIPWGCLYERKEWNNLIKTTVLQRKFYPTAPGIICRCIANDDDNEGGIGNDDVEPSYGDNGGPTTPIP